MIIEYDSVDVDNVVNVTSHTATALMLMLKMTEKTVELRSKKTELRYMQLTGASIPTSDIEHYF